MVSMENITFTARLGMAVGSERNLGSRQRSMAKTTLNRPTELIKGQNNI
jgi:hypothetical protein